MSEIIFLDDIDRESTKNALGEIREDTKKYHEALESVREAYGEKNYTGPVVSDAIEIVEGRKSIEDVYTKLSKEKP